MAAAFKVVHDLMKPGSAQLYTEARGYGFVTGANRKEISRLQPPETNTGFLPQWWLDGQTLTEVIDTPQGVGLRRAGTNAAEDGRSIALSFRQDVPEPGCYRVTLMLVAARPIAELAVFAGRRHLVWQGKLDGGQSLTLTNLCDVSPIIPRGQSRLLSDPAVNLAVLSNRAAGVRLALVKVEAVPARTVYVMGDSTVTDQTANLPYAPGASFGGWGQMLGAWLPEPLCVSNHAHSGLTTESFTKSGHWDLMYPLMKPDDLCLIQFGHNDQKLPQLAAGDGYTKWLRRYLAALRKARVNPIFVTPLARNSWSADGLYNDLLADYAEAVRQVAKAESVPVIDLHAYSMQLWKREGLEGAKRWFFPGDYTHTNDFGAARMGRFVAQALCALVGTGMRPLDVWEPHPPYAVLEPPADCELTPLADNRPDPLAPLRTERPEDPLQRVEALDLVIQLMRFFPINVYNDLYDDVVGHETYAGTVQCAAQNHMIPDAWIEDGKLYPDKAVTLADFLAVLMPAYASRRNLGESCPAPDDVPTFARPAAGLALRVGLVEQSACWNCPLSRREAAEICRKVRI